MSDVIWLPDGFTEALFTYTPTPNVGVRMPAATRTVTYAKYERTGASSLGGTSTVKIPPLLLSLEDTTGEDGGVMHLWHERDGSLVPYRLGNVWEDGHVCWGDGNRTPGTLRSAWNLFWEAPFNKDLWRGLNPHRCDTPVQHVCQQGYGHQCRVSHQPCPVRHRHKCGGSSRWSAKGPCPAACRQTPHKAGKHQPGPEVRAPEISYDDTGAAFFEPAFKLFQPDFKAPKSQKIYNAGYIPKYTMAFAASCQCCEGRCQCRPSCQCCRGECQCHTKNTCPCRRGNCQCPRQCPCELGRCACAQSTQCACDKTALFERYLRTYDVADATLPDNSERQGVRPVPLTRRYPASTVTTREPADAVLWLDGTDAVIRDLPSAWVFEGEERAAMVFGRCHARSNYKRWTVWCADPRDTVTLVLK